ncbi:hypothetical protein [Couchioplanes caeruleus]|uniref:Uncharacterized protein n=2 Tax=Couchioplanes caeruleus TaxID=56438 RepID=A0A1K0FGM8_9ACTN|nr:hypothetical protein [Couchioplanes caeruleus]OJF11993.1 hypothetical protein BG844_23145 [Couchioplanes caeruleus subsp. caeruleus]ROP31969.1 hypothetical protein EDD30_4897 [Couchioplanes caeruleus]
MRLSIGAPPVAKAFGVGFGLVFAAAGAGFALLPLGFLPGGGDPSCPSPDEVSGIPPSLLPPEVRDCVAEGEWLFAGLGPLHLLGLVGIPVFLLGIYLALKSLRTAAWLDGTRVSVRGALRTRTVDLAAAEISVGAYFLKRNADTAAETVERVPQLVAREPGGRNVTVPLRGIGSPQLPEAELRALADAIRPGSPVAAQLRAMADDPLRLRAP